MTIQSYCDTAQCLSSPLRLRILLLLAFATEPLTYNSISSQLQQPSKSIAYHLRELYHNKLVIKNEQGRYSFYSINQLVLNDFVNFIQAAESMASQRGGDDSGLDLNSEGEEQ